MEEKILIRIYALIDPESEQPFYVGRTSMSLSRRFFAHISSAKTSDSPKSTKIRSILQKNLRPKITLLEEKTCSNAHEVVSLEDCWIRTISQKYTLQNKGKATNGKIAGSCNLIFPSENINLLGSMPDSKLAKLTGINIGTIKNKRNSLGIPSFSRQRSTGDWTESNLALLGTMPDTELARKMGRTQHIVERKRNSLGIPAYRIIDWTEEMIAMLGTAPDIEIAKQLGISAYPAKSKRISLGIPLFEESREKEIWTESNLALVGTMPDTKLAKLLGMSRSYIGVRRLSLGIPAYVPDGQSRSDWTESSIALLGTMPDAELAIQIGVSKNIVQHKRNSLGIPPFRSIQRKY